MLSPPEGAIPAALNAKCGKPHIIIGNRAKALLYVPSARAVKRYKQSGHLLKNYRRGSFPRRQFLDLFSELSEADSLSTGIPPPLRSANGKSPSLS